MNKEIKQIKPMICPICGQFYFSELTEDEIENGEEPNSIQCRQCGWFYDLKQTENPNLKGQTNLLSLNEFKSQYKAIIKANPKYVYYESIVPSPTSHLCPVCGKHKFKDSGAFEVCPVCGWEDDGFVEEGGANGISLEEYKKNFNNSHSNKSK